MRRDRGGGEISKGPHRHRVRQTIFKLGNTRPHPHEKLAGGRIRCFISCLPAPARQPSVTNWMKQNILDCCPKMPQSDHFLKVKIRLLSLSVYYSPVKMQFRGKNQWRISLAEQCHLMETTTFGLKEARFHEKAYWSRTEKRWPGKYTLLRKTLTSTNGRSLLACAMAVLLLRRKIFVCTTVLLCFLVLHGALGHPTQCSNDQLLQS